MVCVLLSAGIVGGLLQFPYQRSAEAGRLVALYPSKDLLLFEQFEFPWRFYREKARRDGLVTRKEIHSTVKGFDSMSTRQGTDGPIDTYYFQGLIPFGRLELEVWYDKDERLLGFQDTGPEIILRRVK